MEVDEDGRIVGFEEKPEEPKTIPGTSDCLASMGIYLFEADCLRGALDNDLLDFGKDVIPMLIRQGTPVFAYDFTRRNAIPEWEFVKHEGVRRKELVPKAQRLRLLARRRDARAVLAGQPRPRPAPPEVQRLRRALPPLLGPRALPAREVRPRDAGPDGRRGQLDRRRRRHRERRHGARVGARQRGLRPQLGDDREVGPPRRRASAAGSSPRPASAGAAGSATPSSTRTSTSRRTRSIGYDRAEDERRGLKTVSITGSSDYIVVVPKDFSL